ncbi:Glycosyl hydrolase family protein [Perilla frutescens var. frutescens]|nr:Glycosyl hydrolase family protein [Perilla frutescens var. frutescens]
MDLKSLFPALDETQRSRDQEKIEPGDRWKPTAAGKRDDYSQRPLGLSGRWSREPRSDRFGRSAHKGPLLTDDSPREDWPDDLDRAQRRHHFRSVLSGGGSKPFENAKSADWAEMIDDFQKAALEMRLGIPIIYGLDAVHGNNNVYGTTIFPHNVGLVATR